MLSQAYNTCIEACNECAVACNTCAASCLHEQDVNEGAVHRAGYGLRPNVRSRCRSDGA
jgi:hypothetical protein